MGIFSHLRLARKKTLLSLTATRMKSLSVHEDILRHLWSGQYLDAHRLVTLDGRHLVVLEPGSLNRDSGPDFHDGLIALNGKTFRGDIEFHRTVADWKLHSHHTDEKYNSVILHVVYHSGTADAVTLSASGRLIPILAIEQFLSSPLEKILEHAIRDEYTSRTEPLRCVDRNDCADPRNLQDWIRHLSLDRMKAKAVAMLARLLEINEERGMRETEGVSSSESGHPGLQKTSFPAGESGTTDLSHIEGWQQILYEGIMDGLGYSKNRRPFVTLAQRVTIPYIKRLSADNELSVMEIEALLFHGSGLQFDAHLIKDQDSKVHLHQLRAAWRSLSERGRSIVIPPGGSLRASDWVFSPTRPSNFPTARIAVASELLGRIAYRGLLPGIIRAVEDDLATESEALKRLLELLSIDEDPFWSFHYSFAESSPREHSLLGEVRKYEIVINTILPLCSLYALVFERKRIHERAVRIAAEIPPVEDNVITRKLKKQLLRANFPISSAFDQQGLIQLYERYCSGSRCDECKIDTGFSGRVGYVGLDG
jgi:Protein of unknown function (DUF2851)